MKKKIILSLALLEIVGSPSTMLAHQKAGERSVGPLNTDTLPSQHQVMEKEEERVLAQQRVPKEPPIPLGREYYRSLLEKSVIKHWAVAISGHYSWADETFRCDGCTDSIGNLLFGDPFTIQDVYLLSKLSFQNKIRRDNIDAQPTKERDAASPLPFGDFASDQFLNLLATTTVNIAANYHEAAVKFSGIYRFSLTHDQRLHAAFGVTLPVKKRAHEMDLSFVGGTLFTHAFVTSSNVRSNPLVHFTEWFSSVEDFFQRAVLQPKGLIFEPHQHKTGLGDLTLFGLLDFGGYSDHLDGFQVGLNIVFPTSNKQSGNQIWEVELGNGGAYQFDPFVNILVSTTSPVFNPTFKLAGEFSKKFAGSRRVPGLKSNDVRKNIQAVSDLAPLFVPPIAQAYSGYFVDPFQLYDSTVPFFADRASCATIKIGNKVIVGVGNYFYNAFNLGLRLGLFYDYTHKGSDTICIDPACGTFNTCLLTGRTATRAHQLSWNLTYKFRSLVELSMGSQHVFSGINVPKCHDFFASLVLVF